jgi:hypothetical protein
MKKQTRNVIDITLYYFSKLSDREEHLKELITYHQSQISGEDAEYDRICRETIEWLTPELNNIKLVKQSVTNLLKPKNQ